MLTLDLAFEVAADVPLSDRVLQVAAMFGLDLGERTRRRIVEPTRLKLDAGEVVFITGPSGGGKSTLLRLIAAALAEHPEAIVLRVDHLPPLADAPLVDALAGIPQSESAASDLPDILADLARVGLGDALVMIRRPGELSDGQRVRLHLAQAMGELRRLHGRHPDRCVVVLADEFAAPLDRVTAVVVARQVRKWVDQQAATGHPVCFVAASTHDDLLEPLAPDVLLFKDLGRRVIVRRRRTDSPRRHGEHGEQYRATDEHG
jgi:uncharacterized protein